MMEFCQEVRNEALLPKHSIPFSAEIMTKELPIHFRAPSHLPAYNGTTNPAEHILKLENATLQHMYTDCIKCHIFLTTLTDSAHQWFDQFPAGFVRSFAKFSSLSYTSLLAARNAKNRPSVFFRVKQKEKETLGAYLEHVNKVILEVPTSTNQCYHVGTL
ncbi:UNVERIFIED_CONTAM: hypothetical protein Sradi_5066400 [Sesamum radiatum]|uniref:Retrotransposon gag domain-containing protein n=1 Tax=Sesamum radiatum TaxID=300843 RepID=A0AAW2M4P8_SESRA